MNRRKSVRPERSRGTHLDCASLRSIRTVFLIITIFLAMPTLAQSNLPPAYWANRQLPDARQEARAQDLMDELRCLVCQGQSIADSDAEIAGDMRDLVRRRISEGEEPEAIRAWLIERYGSWVSYKPTASPATWALWLAPLLFLLVGAWIAASRIKRRGDG